MVEKVEGWVYDLAMRKLLERLERRSDVYRAAQKFIDSKMRKLLGVGVEGVSFFTFEDVPKDIKNKAIRLAGMHPPAYVDPMNMAVVVDVDTFGSSEEIVRVLGHELGHLLDMFFGEKVRSGKTLSDVYNLSFGTSFRKGRGTAVADMLSPSENIADMFSDYLAGKSLSSREQRIMNRVAEIVQTS